MSKVNLVKRVGLLTAVLTFSFLYGCSRSTDKGIDTKELRERSMKESFERRVSGFLSKAEKYRTIKKDYDNPQLYIKWIYVLSDVKYDIEKTNSIVTPYVATLTFRFVPRGTKPRASKEEAEKDNEFPSWSPAKQYRYRYEYKDRAWVVLSREYCFPDTNVVSLQGWRNCDDDDLVSVLDN